MLISASTFIYLPIYLLITIIIPPLHEWTLIDYRYVVSHACLQLTIVLSFTYYYIMSYIAIITSSLPRTHDNCYTT